MAVIHAAIMLPTLCLSSLAVILSQCFLLRPCPDTRLCLQVLDLMPIAIRSSCACSHMDFLSLWVKPSFLTKALKSAGSAVSNSAAGKLSVHAMLQSFSASAS